MVVCHLYFLQSKLIERAGKSPLIFPKEKTRGLNALNLNLRNCPIKISAAAGKPTKVTWTSYLSPCRVVCLRLCENSGSSSKKIAFTNACSPSDNKGRAAFSLSTITAFEQIRTDDRADFNSNRRFYRWASDFGEYLEGIADREKQAEVRGQAKAPSFSQRKKQGG